MRHLLLTTRFLPGVGGIQRYLHGLASALHRDHGEVEVLACGVEPSEGLDPPYEVRYVEGVDRRLGERWGDDFLPLRAFHSVVSWARRVALGRRTAASRLGDVARGGDPGLRVYVGVWNEVAHGWCRWLRGRGIPYRLFAYGLEVVRPLDPMRARWRAGDFRGAEVVHACSEASARLVAETFGDVAVDAVPPGVEPPEDPEAVEEAARRLGERLGIGEGERLVATVGRLVRRKGVDRVLRALASSRLEDLPIRYLVAGEGEEREALEREARELGLADRVAFLGQVDERDKWAVLRRADVFAMPVREVEGADWEGFGIAYLEAAAVGVPSVGGAAGGAAEAVGHGETGYVVATGDDEGLADALARLLEDGELRREMGERARERARERFTWERAARRVVEAG